MAVCSTVWTWLWSERGRRCLITCWHSQFCCFAWLEAGWKAPVGKVTDWVYWTPPSPPSDWRDMCVCVCVCVCVFTVCGVLRGRVSTRSSNQATSPWALSSCGIAGVKRDTLSRAWDDGAGYFCVSLSVHVAAQPLFSSCMYIHLLINKWTASLIFSSMTPGVVEKKGGGTSNQMTNELVS